MALKKNSRYNNSSITNPSVPNGQKAVELFASMMIERMQQLKDEPWQKGWMNASGYSGLPRNIDGRNYAASNAFFLQLISDVKKYELPVFLTFNQARNMGVAVNKGAKSFPVVYWDISVKDKDGKRVDWEDFKKMDKAERNECLTFPFIKSYPVFNIDQTNFAQIKPEKMEALRKAFKVAEISDKEGMYASPSLDRMIETQSWYCPIKANKPQNEAYYSPSLDIVVLPMKEQFKKGNNPEEIYRNGMEFYSTMLHEMTHSTLTPDRLNREHGRFGEKKYAREELVAELTAAMLCHSMGFDSKVTDNSAKYLDNWLGALKEEPKFILSVMSDVNKASEMILDRVDEQKIALGETPYLTKNLIAVDEFATIEPELVPFKEALVSEPKINAYGIEADSNDNNQQKIQQAAINNSKDLSSMATNNTDSMKQDTQQKESPLLQQYNEMKAKHPDAILLFRVGDFYETFKEDAVRASEILGITMTRRASGTGSVELAGFPHHALDTYLPKLVRSGARVAICEQLEQPEKKKLAKRGVQQPEISKDKKAQSRSESEKQQNISQLNDNNMAKTKKNEKQQEVEQPQNTVAEDQSTKVKTGKSNSENTAEKNKEEVKTDNAKGQEPPIISFEKDEKSEEKKRRDPQMITVNGDKVTHGHIFKIKDTDAPWFFTANINGDKLKPIPISEADANKFLEKNMTIPELMEKYYPTKIMEKVPDVAFKTPNVIAGKDGQMTVEKFNVYKEKDETKQDFGRYKFYAVVDGQKMSTPAERADLNAYFDRVKTPGQLTEKVFGERLGLPSHYQQFSLPEGMSKDNIRIEKNTQTNKYDIYLDYGQGQKSASKQLSGYDTNALLRTKAANKEQLGAKYLSNEISAFIASGIQQKQEKKTGLKI